MIMTPVYYRLKLYLKPLSLSGSSCIVEDYGGSIVGPLFNNKDSSGKIVTPPGRPADRQAPPDTNKRAGVPGPGGRPMSPASSGRNPGERHTNPTPVTRPTKK